MNQKVSLRELPDLFPKGVELFIGMVSFESRCFSIIETLNLTPDAHCLFFKSSVASTLADHNLARMVEMVGDRHTVIELDMDSPIATADAISKAIRDYLAGALIENAFIDTTTFTHELLLILLRVVRQSQILCKLSIGYTGAEEYSTNTDVEHVWLSRGVSQVRSVLGYPGSFVPSKRLYLIVLAGFEHERAAAVIEQFEPARLTLMCGDPKNSVSASHYETNKRFFDELSKFVERTKQTQLAVDALHFSCIDPFSVRDLILDLAGKHDDYNIVICPMNTKISTIGVGLAALQNERIQIAYARAIEYNETGYSTPSTMATVFEYQTKPSETLNAVKEIKQPSAPSMVRDAGNLPA